MARASCLCAHAGSRLVPVLALTPARAPPRVRAQAIAAICVAAVSLLLNVYVISKLSQLSGGPSFSSFVLGSPHVTLIELRLVLISYQD